MNGIKKILNNPVAIIIIAGIVIIFVWVVFIPWITNLWGKATLPQGNQTAANAAAQEVPTLTNGQAQAIADSVYNDCSVVWTNDISDIESQLGNCQNDADYNLVFKTFGTRNWGTTIPVAEQVSEIIGFGGGGSGNMSAFLRAFLTQDQITTINNSLSAKGLASQI